ncbi:MAG: hypothetical protein ACO2Y5_04290 [Nitrosopumilaceae archaeon]|uniref:Uncharacterized protein n=1 Tax=Candidatus Nitrosomaritimum aestuariumsis TaxID=3342354 RepID=A0AC60W568_9ARCH|nr:hypothetical protein [Nitrosopumilaceae archaeon]
MNHQIDAAKTLDIIERMKLAKIGEYKKWKVIVKKIKNEQDLLQSEIEYFSNFTRIYKNLSTTNRSKIYHARLSEHDVRPPCQLCGENSEFYCNMNDQYFCTIHVVGHDDNEI